MPHKHLKIADQDAIQHTMGSASHPTSSTIKQEPGKPGTVTNLSGADPPLLSSDFRFLREHDELTYFPGMTRFSEYKSWEQRLSLVSHVLPQARLDHAHTEVQESTSHLTDCLEECSDEDVNVSVGESGTHPASVTFSRAMTPQHSKRIVEVDSGDVIKLLSDAKSLTSIHDAFDAVSHAAISESRTLSSMSSIYGSKSLYRVKECGSSQCTTSSLPEMCIFDTTIETMRHYELTARNVLQNPYEDSGFFPSPHNLDNRKGKAWLESAMNGNIFQIVGLLSDVRNGVDVNHKSPTSNGQTPLMIVIRRSGLVLRELLILCLMTHQWPLLSMTDYDGKSIIDLAASDGTGLVVMRFIERITAVMCCNCPDQKRRGSLCEWIAHTTPSKRCGLVLEGGPVRYPFRTECPWGERLLRHDWLTVETLQEIDDWMASRLYCDSLHRARMANELRDVYVLEA